MDFSKETVLITGASSGLGEAMSLRFSELGAKVVMLARRKDRLLKLQKILKNDSFYVAIDISDTNEVAELPSNIPDEFSDISVLINNAACGTDRGPVQAAKLQDWDEMIEVNVKGLLHVTKAFLPKLLQRSHGHIINIGSLAGQFPGPNNAVYSATKAFVRQFSKNMKSDLISSNVRCTYIAPGAVETEFSLVRWRGDKNKASKIYEGYEGMTAKDIADAAIYACDAPLNVDVTEIEIMPHAQGFGPRIFHRHPS